MFLRIAGSVAMIAYGLLQREAAFTVVNTMIFASEGGLVACKLRDIHAWCVPRGVVAE